jgi:hypothetical protein
MALAGSVRLRLDNENKTERIPIENLLLIIVSAL